MSFKERLQLLPLSHFTICISSRIWLLEDYTNQTSLTLPIFEKSHGSELLVGRNSPSFTHPCTRQQEINL